MLLSELKAQIAIEFLQMDRTLTELRALREDIGENEPTNRDKTAAGAFLAQFYGGVENTLKRMLKFAEIDLPSGESWHLELLQIFHDPTNPAVPRLMDDQLYAQMSTYRKFRHVVLHSYGFELQWSRMLSGMDNVQQVAGSFKQSVQQYLDSLATE